MEEEERMDGNKIHNERNVVRENCWGKLKRSTEKTFFFISLYLAHTHYQGVGNAPVTFSLLVLLLIGLIMMLVVELLLKFRVSLHRYDGRGVGSRGCGCSGCRGGRVVGRRRGRSFV